MRLKKETFDIAIEKGFDRPVLDSESLQSWFRKVHDIDVYVVPNGARMTPTRLYHPMIWFKNKYQTECKNQYSYEEALEEGLSEALKLI